ncbi:Cytidylate kinase [bioreactor metagenome]|uniref:(d)CMP kinase n=1 Tax=bioreactor metagenome TaxID=1076179 RepID=A0A645F128_9ZZZZ
MYKTTAVAIDGPSAAGKSTVARALAQKLGFIYVDTGALYRSIGYYAHQRVLDTTDATQVVPLLPEINIEMKYVDGLQRMLLNGEDVTEGIRLPEMSMAASNVSAIPAVRSFLLDLQRDLAKANNVVMDGRDIGTVVLPDAKIKFFLTATPEARACRRFLEFQAKGQVVEYEKLLAETKQRDYNDMNRATAPLCQADDAILIDSTDLTFNETLERMTAIIEERL